MCCWKHDSSISKYFIRHMVQSKKKHPDGRVVRAPDLGDVMGSNPARGGIQLMTGTSLHRAFHYHPSIAPI